MQHDSVGPKAGFSYFVFKQLYGKHQYAKLLRLGEDFQEELAIFLKEHKDLLWLHEIFLNHFSAASETLHALALSNDGGSDLVTDGGSDSQDTKQRPSLADRRRLLNLSKIATVAGLLFSLIPFFFSRSCIEYDYLMLLVLFHFDVNYMLSSSFISSLKSFATTFHLLFNTFIENVKCAYLLIS